MLTVLLFLVGCADGERRGRGALPESRPRAAPSMGERAPAATPTATAELPSDDGVYLPVKQDRFFRGDPNECWVAATSRPVASRLMGDDALSVRLRPEAGAPGNPLWLAMVVHVEPHKQYNEGAPMFDKHVDNLDRLSALFVEHGAKLTIQVQPPFVTMSLDRGAHVTRKWAEMGHEIAIHFHEVAQVDSGSSPKEWTRALTAIARDVERDSGRPVVTWSGGHTYEHLFPSAHEVGLKYLTNFKDFRNQFSDPLYTTTSPWRPGGEGMPERKAHNQAGYVVYLPSGIWPVACQKNEAVPRPITRQSLDYLTSGIARGLDVAVADRPGVTYGTLHPEDLGSGHLSVDEELARWEEWFDNVIDPAVARGQLKWGTIAEVGAAWEGWERARGKPADAPAAPPTPPAEPPRQRQ